MHKYIKALLIVGFALVSDYAVAVSEHTGLWTGIAVMGPARFGPDIKYYYDTWASINYPHLQKESNNVSRLYCIESRIGNEPINCT